MSDKDEPSQRESNKRKRDSEDQTTDRKIRACGRLAKRGRAGWAIRKLRLIDASLQCDKAQANGQVKDTNQKEQRCNNCSEQETHH